MQNYTIWFHLCGKKMKTTIEANSPDHAEYLLRGKLIIDKVQMDEEPQDDAMLDFEHIKNTIFGKGGE